MKTNTIITIGRQFASGGRDIGEMIAKDFGIKIYDKEMLSLSLIHIFSLPFVSYGLTSVVCLYIGIGLVLNVGLQPNKYQ